MILKELLNGLFISNSLVINVHLQVIQDEFLSEEIEMYRATDSNQMPPPLERFKRSFTESKLDTNSNDNISSLSVATSSCMRDMYHFARLSGLHVLECIMDTALSTIKQGQLQEASNVCVQS